MHVPEESFRRPYFPCVTIYLPFSRTNTKKRTTNLSVASSQQYRQCPPQCHWSQLLLRNWATQILAPRSTVAAKYMEVAALLLDHREKRLWRHWNLSMLVEGAPSQGWLFVPKRVVLGLWLSL